ncbi:MAG: electron transfer flavoprotein subunit beta [Deltaproteobacteria bacterium]|nr:MAG: electron transfer flavoprotein subunit beta [Deltaproteobacteria bacterium]
MDVVVCLKRVPEVAEVDLQLDPSGRAIKTEDLPFVLNDWDSYALEEAVRIKERTGGTVTAITVGPQEDEEVLRRALALGADQAMRIDDPRVKGSDAYALARVLARAIEGIPYDLILTGAQASDDGYAQVGPALAEILGIPHATLVTNLELGEGVARVRRELEGGMEEEVEVRLPALLTIQTGINEPRYVSILGIRRVAKKEIRVLDLDALGLGEGEVGEKGALLTLRRLFLPPVGEGAEILEGPPEEVAGRVLEVLERGGVI